MAYSFGTVWTLALIIALVATVIHQVRFQSSPGQANMEHELYGLKQQNQSLKVALITTQNEYDDYREWVKSWREVW